MCVGVGGAETEMVQGDLVAGMVGGWGMDLAGCEVSVMQVQGLGCVQCGVLLGGLLKVLGLGGCGAGWEVSGATSGYGHCVVLLVALLLCLGLLLIGGVVCMVIGLVGAAVSQVFGAVSGWLSGKACGLGVKVGAAFGALLAGWHGGLAAGDAGLAGVLVGVAGMAV